MIDIIISVKGSLYKGERIRDESSDPCEACDLQEVCSTGDKKGFSCSDMDRALETDGVHWVLV